MPGVQLPGPPSGGGFADPSAIAMPTQFLGVNGMITADVLASDDEYKEVSQMVISKRVHVANLHVVFAHILGEHPVHALLLLHVSWGLCARRVWSSYACA
jgi:hypothetical protein